MALTPQLAAQRLEAWLLQLSQFPWRTTVHTLRERYREDRLGLTASSLTFTTLLALVPLMTVALAVFTAFPTFAQMQQVLERWLMDSLIPVTISRQVLDYITQFAAQASRLGAVGFSILTVTALALILTIDRTLNNIWRVRRLRPLGQRVLIYWAALTLGPLVLAGSLALTSAVASAASQGLGEALPGGARLLFDGIEFLVLASGMAALYHYVPNTHVQWRHAWAGGLFVATGISLAKNVLVLYLASVPTYSVLYGTFATLPILLLWIYVAWVIVLLGAVVAAYLP
ncbi:YihY family inner membrane protein, partial [Melaminivora alkalimesophila]